MSESSTTPRVGPSAEQRLIDRLGSRYLFILLAVATVIVIDQALVQPGLASLNAFAPAINVAGRQRMLSQRLTKCALALQANNFNDQARTAEMQRALQLWEDSHRALTQGDPEQGILPLSSAEMLAELALLEPHYRAMHRAAASLTAIPRSETLSHETRSEQTRIILEHEADYLSSMDRLVGLLEQSSEDAVNRLRYISLIISASILLFLLAVGRYVLRPAAETIRHQVDVLETRVAERTAELSASHASLLHEIHERESAEFQSRQLTAQLAHAGRVSTLSHLSAGLAHELNQPLAAIVNYAEACEVLSSAPQANPKLVQTHLQQVRQSALFAGDIVRRMRNFIRPQAADVSRCDLHELVRDVATLLHVELEHLEVCLTLELKAKNHFIHADSIQIQQVLVNLIHNAAQVLQASPPANRAIRIATSGDSETLTVAVTDNGPGLPAEIAQSMFAPFVTTKPHGLGLGLFICRCLIEQHDGSIRAESSPPHSNHHGTTIQFSLPCSREDVSIAASQADDLHRG